MYTDKITDMIAHFIGLFDADMDEARLRTRYTEGRSEDADHQLPQDRQAANDDPNYDVSLQDFDPGVKYRAAIFHLNHTRAGHAHTFEDSLHKLREIASRDLSTPHFRAHGHGGYEEDRSELMLYAGPGSSITHVSQLTLLEDDDYLNMTDGPNQYRDTSFVTQRTVEYYNEAAQFTPFNAYHRTDTYEGVQSIARDVHDFAMQSREHEVTSLGTGADQDFVIADTSINGTYINGVLSAEKPDIDDFMPDRGIAKPLGEPEKSDIPLESHGAAPNTLDVAAGANIVANLLSVTDTSVISPVLAVMGNYHQIDAITQSFVYSDHDSIDAAFSVKEDHAGTVANNIASFERSNWSHNGDAGSSDATDSTIFPTAWRVSYVQGDVSFVHWIEQYHFVSDNDTMTVTTSGADVSVLTGGNSAINLAGFLGIGMQYDLVIVGGNVIDMNMISQIAVLYDNDTIHAATGAPDASVQSGNNLLWNEASIHNIGSNDRFAAMPDYMNDAVKAINERDPHMPEGLSTDPNFAGYPGLNVLYITGNVYDVTYLKQVSVLGDSDQVTLAASKVLANNEDATVHIDTGSNAVVNIASIVDYDSFGGSTYVSGNLYSDSVLIQGGIVEHDTADTHPTGDKLANEVIAFLDDGHHTDHSADLTINGGHDLSWSQAHPVDVMQTAVA
ncbi:hypothetical protein [Agrobacterium larrymoorei]|uniref:FHA domain-containing protein n=1 Tax=Agrobacterium larrymoorei TaxID=160699 RepID=A0A4D7DSM2_9HYPH|nr:hypothetical protein [Agrobacterium larrymoorei]QCI99458.1 hypothetical protein CFBP5473_15760 [Agrobacterium larrymoorei]QYA09004.1 hypothetical protein J5285_16500 [Agrobacterium larrymoorei]